MSRTRRLWDELVRPPSPSATGDMTQPDSTGRRTTRDRAVDLAACAFAAALGALFLRPELGRSGETRGKSPGVV